MMNAGRIVEGDIANGSKVDHVYQILKRRIIDHELKEMEPLSERKISILLNVSRTPVHVALQRLQKEKFITHTPELGSFVAPVTYELIQEVYEIREVLEGLCARLCANSLSEDEQEELRHLQEQFENAFDNSDFAEATRIDLLFHGFIISHSMNNMLKEIVHTVFEHTERITRLVDYTKLWTETVRQQHRAAVEAIIAGDADEAERRVREHISSAKGRWLSRITRV